MLKRARKLIAEVRSQESGVEQALSLAFRRSCLPAQLENCCICLGKEMKETLGLCVGVLTPRGKYLGSSVGASACLQTLGRAKHTFLDGIREPQAGKR